MPKGAPGPEGSGGFSLSEASLYEVVAHRDASLGDVVMFQQRLSLITLGVGDLDVSRAFYTQLLGWHTPDDGDALFFDMGGYALSLFPMETLAEDIGEDVALPERAGFNGFTLAYNVGSIAEVDALFEKLEAQGVTILKAPQKVFWGGYSGYFADPDGHPWEVAYNPFVTITEDGRMLMTPPEAGAS